MDKEKFIENLQNQYEDPADIKLEMDSDFRKIESYDSLTGMTIMVMLKDEYNVEITEKEYLSKKTVKELFEYVQQNK